MWWTIRREKMRKALFLRFHPRRPRGSQSGHKKSREERSPRMSSFLSPPDRPSPLFSPLPSLPATLNFLYNPGFVRNLNSDIKDFKSKRKSSFIPLVCNFGIGWYKKE